MKKMLSLSVFLYLEREINISRSDFCAVEFGMTVVNLC